MSTQVYFSDTAVKPWNMEPEDFVPYMKKYEAFNKEDKSKIFLRACPPEGLRVLLSDKGAGRCSATDRKHKLCATVRKMFDQKHFTISEAFVYLSTLGSSSLGSKANYNDSFARVNNLEFSQEIGKLSGSVLDDVRTFIADRPVDEKKAYESFVHKEENKPVILVKKQGALAGVASMGPLGINYTANKTSLDPVKFDNFKTSFAAIASILARHVEIDKDGSAKAITYSDVYVKATGLNLLFKDYSNLCKRVGLAGVDLSAIMADYIKPVKGRGASAESYWYEVLNLACSAELTPITEESLAALVTAYNTNVLDGGLALRINNGLATLSFTPSVYQMPTMLDGDPVWVNSTSHPRVAIALCNARRNGEGEGKAGASGQSLHYALGTKLPFELLDVVTLATDLRPFVTLAKSSGKPIGLVSVAEVIDYEPYLLALRYLNFSGTVIVADADVGRILEKHNSKPKAPDRYTAASKSGHVGHGKYTLIKDTVPRDAFVICVVKNYGIKHGLDESLKKMAYQQMLPGRKQVVELYDNYLVNVYCPYEPEYGAYASFEAHNLMGWLTNNEDLLTFVDSCGRGNIVSACYVQPFYGDYAGEAAARANMANLCRAQFVYTLSSMFTLTSEYGIFSTYPHKGNLTGIKRPDVIIDGISIAAIVNNPESRQMFESSGSEEIKLLIRQEAARSLVPAGDTGNNNNSPQATVAAPPPSVAPKRTAPSRQAISDEDTYN